MFCMCVYVHAHAPVHAHGSHNSPYEIPSNEIEIVKSNFNFMKCFGKIYIIVVFSLASYMYVFVL